MAFSVAQKVKKLPAMQVTQDQSLCQEDPLENGMATYFSIFAWRIPWTEEPGGLQSMRSKTVRHYRVTNTLTFTQWDSREDKLACLENITALRVPNSICSLHVGVTPGGLGFSSSSLTLTCDAGHEGWWWGSPRVGSSVLDQLWEHCWDWWGPREMGPGQ